ncbi:MAG: hypothetical protein GWO24_26455, partial [Akkermansiaceae bacterium]|nr:hypothetical protein [Akkermansiaceae bacterium]
MTIRFHRLMTISILLSLTLAGGAPLAAQVVDSDTRELARLPAAPPDHILDAGELFQRHPDRRRAISERLRRLKREHDLPVYLAVYAGILDSSISQRARLIYEKWIGADREGVVVVYNTDTLEREIVTPGSGYAGPAGSGSSSRLPDYQMIPILAELKLTLEGVEDRIVFLDRSMEILADRLDALLRKPEPRIADRPALKLVAIMLVVGVGLTLLGFYGNRRLHLAEKKAREQYLFPEVSMSIRLGAPFGGGCQSVVGFSGSGSDGEAGAIPLEGRGS